MEERVQVLELAEPEGPEHGAGREIAQYRTDLETPHDRHDDSRGAEENEGVGIAREIDAGRHLAPVRG